MAYNYSQPIEDDFDPRELRRRRLLAPLPGAEEAMAPDPQDEEEENTLGYPGGANSVPPPGAAPTALNRYKQALGGMPTAAGYKPGFGRRLVGAMVGLSQGPEAQDAYVQRPYTQALQNWQQALKPTQALAQLEENQTKQQQANAIAQQRAEAYSRSATAREKIATATEKLREYQQARMPWEPQTKDEAIELASAKKGPQRDYAGEQAARIAASSTANKERIAAEDRREQSRQSNQRTIANIHEGGSNARNNARIAAAIEKPKAPPSPQAQSAAETLAVKELLRIKPEYAHFVDIDARGTHHIKGIDTLPKAHWYNSIEPAQESLARETYQQFLSDLDKEKKRVIGRQQGPGWDSIKPRE